MNLLADENQHPAVVARLRAAGHVVEFIRESSPGARDEDILARQDIGSWVLVTYDSDFGNLIFNRGLPSPGAVLYLRLNRVSPSDIAARLLDLLEAGIELRHITTITRDGERLKPFPAGAYNG